MKIYFRLVFLSILFISLFAFISSTSKAYADGCPGITDPANVSVQTPIAVPGQANTYTISGSIKNCDIPPAPDGQKATYVLYIKFIDTSGNASDGCPTVAPGGNFMANCTVPGAGTYKVDLFVNASQQTNQNDPNLPTITNTVSVLLNCKDPVGQDPIAQRSCPTNCPAGIDPGSATGMSCGGQNQDMAITPSPTPILPPCDLWIDQNGVSYTATQVVQLPIESDKKIHCAKLTTAIGTINTDPISFIQSLLRIFLSISGGIAVLVLIMSGYRYVTSMGNKEAIEGAKESITSAIIGILFLLFSITILQLLGVQILQIPGFK